jgi:hypothetical protein
VDVKSKRHQPPPAPHTYGPHERRMMRETCCEFIQMALFIIVFLLTLWLHEDVTRCVLLPDPTHAHAHAHAAVVAAVVAATDHRASVYAIETAVNAQLTSVKFGDQLITVADIQVSRPTSVQNNSADGLLQTRDEFWMWLDDVLVPTLFKQTDGV